MMEWVHDTFSFAAKVNSPFFVNKNGDLCSSFS